MQVDIGFGDAVYPEPEFESFPVLFLWSRRSSVPIHAKPPSRPSKPPQRYHLLLLRFFQDITHANRG
jgi:hypothetical protein